MLRHVRVVVVLPLLVFSSQAVGAPAAENSRIPVFTHGEMEADLKYLNVHVKQAWAYAEDKRAFLGVDVDGLHAAARRKLDEVDDADDFYFAVKEYVGGLMDGHAGVQPGHSSPRLSTPMRWPFVVTRLEGRFYVKAIEGEGASPRPGDEILSVNGVFLSNRFEAALAGSTGSTPAGRQNRALNTMRYGREKQLRVEVARVGDSNLVCDLVAVGESSGAEEPIRWKTLEGKVGYLRLPSFRQDMKLWEKGGRRPDALQAALAAKKKILRQAFAELKGTPALMLDLRGNSGGSDALGHFLAQFLCDTEAHPIYYELWTRQSEDLVALPDFAYRTNFPAAALDQRTAIRIVAEKGIPRYPGKLAVLMDEGCFSACDCFLNYLAAAAPETVFVGRPNGAGAGAPRPILRLPQSKMVITLCVMQVWNPKGQLIESRPLNPTVPVKWTRADLLQGRDPDVEAALRRLEHRGEASRL